MNMLALHSARSFRQETPRNLDVEFFADDVFRLCSCLLARRKLSNLLSVLTPFLWSTDSSGHSPNEMAHAARCAKSLRPKKTPVKYPLFCAGVANASAFAYRVFHLAQDCCAVHFASSKKCEAGRSRQRNNPVSGLYSMASKRSFGCILVITQLTPKDGQSKETPKTGLRAWLHSSKENQNDA